MAEDLVAKNWLMLLSEKNLDVALDNKFSTPKVQEIYDATKEVLSAYDFDVENFEGKGRDLLTLLLNDVSRRLTKIDEATKERTGAEYTSGRFLNVPGTNLQKSGGFGGQAGAPDVKYTELGRAEAVTKEAKKFLQKAKDLDQDIKTHRRDLSQGSTVLSDEEWEQWVKNRAKDLDLDPNIFRRNIGSKRNALDVKDLQGRLSATISNVEARAKEASDFVEEVRVLQADTNSLERIVKKGLKGKDLGKFLSDEGLKEFNELYEGKIPEEAPAIAKIFSREISEEQIRQDNIAETGPTDFASTDDVNLRESPTLNPAAQAAVGDSNFLEESTFSSGEDDIEAGERDRFAPAGAEEGLVQSRQVGAVDPVEVVSDPAVVEQQTALNIERAARGLPALVVDGLMGTATEAAIALSEGGYRQAEVDALLAVDAQDPVELDQMSPEVQKYIMENFGTVGYFSDRQDMMIPDPSGGGGEVNAYTYITENQLTNLEQIRSLMSQTKWFNTKGVALKQFEQDWNALGGLQLGDDAVSGSFSGATEAQKDLIDVEMDVIRREAKRLQLGLSEEDIWQLAFNAKSLGMDSYEVKEQFTKTYNAQLAQVDQGYFNDLRYQVSDEASKYMLDIGANDLNDMAEQLYLGNTTTEILESNFRTQAKNANPALASVIDQGYTPRMYFSPYKNQAEKLLGRPVDFMGNDSGLFTKLAGSEVSGDGLQRPMTSSEFGRAVRGMAEWEFTDNARDEAYDAVSQITRMFGAVG